MANKSRYTDAQKRVLRSEYRRICLVAKMTYKDVAALLGVSEVTSLRWASSMYPNISMLRMLADKTGVTTNIDVGAFDVFRDDRAE